MILLRLIAILTSLSYVHATFAQSTNNSAPPEATSLDAITQRLASASDLTDQNKTDIGQLVQTIQSQIAATAKAKLDATGFATATNGAADAIKQAKTELAKPISEPTPPKDSAALSDLQQQLTTTQAGLAQAQTDLAAATAAPTTRQSRTIAIPGLIAAAQSQLDAVKTSLALPASTSEPPLLVQAKRMQLETQQQLLLAQIDGYQKELASYAATTDLVPLQRQLADRHVAMLTAQMNQLQAGITQRRVDEAARWRAAIAKDLQSADAATKSAAQSTKALIDQYEQVNNRIASSSAKVDELKSKLDAVKGDYTTTTQRVDAVGLTEALGLLLRQQQARLVAERHQYLPDGQGKAQMQQLQLEMFQDQDQLNLLNQSSTKPDSVSTLRIAILDKLVPAQTALFQNLVTVDTDSRQLIEAIDKYLNFIQGNLLWIPSTGTLSSDEIPQSIAAARWLLTPSSWRIVASELFSDCRTNPVRSAFFGFSMVAAFATHRRRRQRLESHGKTAARRNCQSIRPTFAALTITIVSSAILPLIMLGIGAMCIAPASNEEVLRAIGYGFYACGVFLIPLELMRHVAAPSGLAQSHFRWADSTRAALSSKLRWFYPATLFLFIAVVLEHQSNADWQSSLGRIGLIGFWLVVAVALHWLFRPQSGLIPTKDGDSERFILFRSRRIIYAATLLIPTLLIALSAAGYHYTSVELSKRVLWTLVVATGLLIASEFLTRLVLVHRRRLAILESMRERERKAEVTTGETLMDEAGINAQQEERCDLVSVGRQSRKVVHLLFGVAFVSAALWFWKDMFPAFDLLNQVTLWSVGVAGEAKPVTLADVLIALLTVTLTLVSIKNMPGLLELILLQRLPLDSGARYAVTTMFRYALFVVGLIVALSFLSIPWSHYSWIVAAGTVGLGFGMQEIVGNFVSGIIILLERPIRVGDMVTVDGNIGFVTRIQMRATTITTRDHQELIVPNKDFITGKILNWSLSNVTNRILINVGVAYGSDPDQVRDCLLKTVTDHPMVMSVPEPVVSMESFGDSSLNFEIWCYLPDLTNRQGLRHELLAAITRALDGIGVTIPFPQRDIHIVHDSSGANQLK
ncbi:mechanosensitive ion channel domain-containing protein [Planctomycetes bacterium TBK1r]|uniref:Mechanosensitive channel MscK n=1 Tax=Stieleria magnilauensis TaxID=2527963 RepID=A0ABX5XW77_9BACT|nr:Mechanosensitive channel MscK precursor [Planctomycetes bacterium TBK1r]